jgi:hypothetical protein
MSKQPLNDYKINVNGNYRHRKTHLHDVTVFRDLCLEKTPAADAGVSLWDFKLNYRYDATALPTFLDRNALELGQERRNHFIFSIRTTITEKVYRKNIALFFRRVDADLTWLDINTEEQIEGRRLKHFTYNPAPTLAYRLLVGFHACQIYQRFLLMVFIKYSVVEDVLESIPLHVFACFSIATTLVLDGDKRMQKLYRLCDKYYLPLGSMDNFALRLEETIRFVLFVMDYNIRQETLDFYFYQMKFLQYGYSKHLDDYSVMHVFGRSAVVDLLSTPENFLKSNVALCSQLILICAARRMQL